MAVKSARNQLWLVSVPLYDIQTEGQAVQELQESDAFVPDGANADINPK
jgi:hypothetical protein